MIEEILPIPPIPDGLREAAQRGTLIPFIGAGVSRIAGCPSWSELADQALAHHIVSGNFSHSQLAQIKHLNPRVKLSIALRLQKEFGGEIDFCKLLHPAETENNKKGKQLFGSLSLLGKTFVTTNYDKWLNEDLGMSELTKDQRAQKLASVRSRHRRIIYKVNDFKAENLQPNTVIHLHGSVLDPMSMILTTQDYISHYSNDIPTRTNYKENPVLTFLEFLFNTKTVLFVGYGLEELEILEYVILKTRGKSQKHSNEIKHFLIQGYFSHEFELMKSLEKYFLDFGIQLLPYLRDQKDYEQLLDVLENFARLIPASSPMVLQDFLEMEALLDG